MKLNKKKLFSLSLVIVLIAILSFGTLAWFNDSESVTNKFYVASDGTGKEDSDNPDADKIFSVDIWEHDDKDGDDIIDEGEKEQVGLEFKDIAPGDVLEKKPYVENTGSYDQYVRIVITFDSRADWWKLFANGGLESPMQMLNLDTNLWVDGEHIENSDSYIYAYYLKDPLHPGSEPVPTFSTVTIPYKLEQMHLVGMGVPTLEVHVDAIQVDNMPEGAKAAFDSIGWTAGTEYKAN